MRTTPTKRSESILPLAMLVITAGAQAAGKPDLVKPQMLANVSAIKPGQTFTVGVLLRVEPKWHVYWQNPGDSGRATTVKLQAPEGFKVKSVQYPVPLKFNQPGDVVGYGYEEELLLTVDVTAPANAKAGQTVKFDADVAWLCCKDVCIPGKAKLSLELPVAAESKPANEKVFADWAERFPRGQHPAVLDGSWQVDSKSGSFSQLLKWPDTPPKKVELYPGRDDAIEVQSATATSKGEMTLLQVQARLLPGQTPEADTLPGVVVYTDGKGVRRGINVSIPTGALKPASTKSN
jgi:thiol:disulfide interchange protein DsbD